MQTVMKYVNYFLGKTKEHAISAYAAQAAFFLVLSFFPFVMLLMTLIRYLPITQDMMLSLAMALPSHISDFIVSLLNEIYAQSPAAIISLTVITAIWSASKGIMAVVRGFNAIYDINETRGYFYVRFISSLYTIVFVIGIAAALVLLVFGNRLMLTVKELLPPTAEAPVIISFRVLIGIIVLFVFFLGLYLFIPNRKSSILQEAPGAMVTTLGWIIFSFIYSFYIDNFANFNAYGSLTTLIFLMLWLYFGMYILFIGCEVNVFLQEKFHQS